MRVAKLFVSVASVMVLAGVAYADKQQEMDEFAIKPWQLRNIPVFTQILADVNETEPNDTCPGEAYTLNDTFHGAISPAGDEDWITFTCDEGAEITAGTDADGGLPTVDTVIELWDDTCTTMLTSNDDGGPGLYSLIDGFVAPYTGSYNLKIRGFSATSSTGNYIAVANCATPMGPGFCPIGLYKASKINVNLPITDADGTIETPGIKFNPQPGFVITDVVIDMNIEHTWVGDLVITLKHTADDGTVTTVDLVNQPGVPQSSFGCSGDLISDPENKYFFGSNPGLEPLAENDCPAELAPACYAVAVENSVGLEAFNGIDKGDGVWTLCITDNAAGDDGFIHNWSVHLLCEQPISVEEKSWGAIKGLYSSN